MWNFTIRLDNKYQNLKGDDYYFTLSFNMEKFKGIDTFMPITGDWTILEKNEITYFNSQDINFSYKTIKSGYQFHFNDNVTCTSALKIIKEIYVNILMNNHQKCALYFVETKSEIGQLIF